MSDRHNLGLAILLGILLTGGLMFALYQQSGLSEAELAQDVVALETPAISASFSPFAAEKEAVAPAATAPQAVKQKEVEPVAAIATSDKASVTVAEIGVLGEDSMPAASAELVEALPEQVELSLEELGTLSAEERVRYEKALVSYQEVRTQVLALDRERNQLKQRIDHMFQRNDVMEQEVKAMRESLQALPEGE